MPLPIQLISTDFDGTLHAEFETPPVPLESAGVDRQLATSRSSGVINTGRDLSSVMEGLARARLSIKPDYLVIEEREIYVHEDSQYIASRDWNLGCKRAPGLVRTGPSRHAASDGLDERALHRHALPGRLFPVLPIAESNEQADAFRIFWRKLRRHSGTSTGAE